MKKFWSKYKITENKNPSENKTTKTSVKSLSILTKNSIASESNLSESYASLMMSARSKIKSESNQLAPPNNPEGE